jgi:hypothetical protein
VRIHDLGDGEPEYAVVACLHGDETCGLRAVEHVRDLAPELREPLRLVVANEEAIDAEMRCLDEDLNRAFPGEKDGDTHESRLAVEVLDAVAGKTVLDLHSTVSSAEPFAIVVDATQRALDLAGATGTDHVVDASYVGGGLLDHVDGVAVECGIRGTDAAAGNAIRIVARFLTAAELIDDPAELLTDDVPAGAPGHELPDRSPDTPPEVLRIDGEAEGAGFEFCGENFVRVAAGETFAVSDDAELTAEEAFYPVLMSTDGYDDMVGFTATRLGALPDVDPEMLRTGTETE